MAAERKLKQRRQLTFRMVGSRMPRSLSDERRVGEEGGREEGRLVGRRAEKTRKKGRRSRDGIKFVRVSTECVPTGRACDAQMPVATPVSAHRDAARAAVGEESGKNDR